MYQVKDAMSNTVISVQPEVTVETAIGILLEYGVSGAPVIDGEGNLCGIITQFQLLEVIYDPQIKTGRVRDFMTRQVLTVEEDDLLGLAANHFIVHRIRRLPVVRGDQVVGIISRSDLLRYFTRTGEQIGEFFDQLRGAAETPTALAASWPDYLSTSDTLAIPGR
jgi:CBS domain-containing protein